MRLKYRLTAILMLLTMLPLQITGYAANLSADTEQMAERLEAFGILKVNSLKADKAVSRAQLAEWIARAAGAQTDVKGSGNVYSDVPASHNMCGAVETAYSRGIVGAADMFYPDRQVSLTEAAAMAVNALGYSEVAKTYGGYPSGYMTVATQQSITKGISNQQLNTEDAVRLVSNMLDANPVEIKFSNGNPTYEIMMEETFLEKTFDVTKYKVQIENVDVSKKRVIATILSGSLKGKTYEYSTDDRISIDKIGGEADIYTDNNDNMLIVYIIMRKSSTVIYDFISEVNKNDRSLSVTPDEWRYVYFENEKKQYTLSRDVKITYNDKPVNYESYDYIDCFSKAVIQDNQVTRIDIYSLSEGGLIYRADEDELRFSKGTVYENYWKGFSRAPELQIFIDGRAGCKMHDLRTNMVFDYWYNDDDKFIIVASSRVATGTVGSISGDEITIDGEIYTLARDWFVFSDAKNSYIEGDISKISGEPVNAFIDDRKRIRYILPDTAKSEKRTFNAFVMRAYEEDEDRYVKLYRADGNNEVETYKLKEKLKGEYNFDYLKSVEKNLDALGFLSFTTNSKNEISKVERVENFGYVSSQSTYFNELYYEIGKQFAGDAKIFALMNIDGEFTVKPVDYETQLVWTQATGALTVISDFNVEKNPIPKYIVLGRGSDTIKDVGISQDVLSTIEWKEDDLYTITFVGGENYTVTEEFINNNKLKACSLVRFNRKSLGKNPISIVGVTDLSGNPEDWKCDNYDDGAMSGFYRADDIVFRNDSVIQFRINGRNSDVYMFYDDINGGSGNMKVYEYVKKGKIRRAPTTEAVGTGIAEYIRPVNRYPVMNIQKGDDVWFHIRDDGIRKIDYIIYRSNASFF